MTFEDYDDDWEDSYYDAPSNDPCNKYKQEKEDAEWFKDSKS